MCNTPSLFFDSVHQLTQSIYTAVTFNFRKRFVTSIRRSRPIVMFQRGKRNAPWMTKSVGSLPTHCQFTSFLSLEKPFCVPEFPKAELWEWQHLPYRITSSKGQPLNKPDFLPNNSVYGYWLSRGKQMDLCLATAVMNSAYFPQGSREIPCHQ
jgi:hypothetical protein